MKTVQNILIFTLAAALFTACNKDETNPEFVDVPVVEAYLYSGNIFEMKVSRQIPFSGDAVFSSDNIDLLEINIFDGNIIWTLIPLGNGIYRDSSFQINADSEYELKFVYNDLVVEASTVIPSKPLGFTSSVSQVIIESGGFPTELPEPVELNWENPDQSYYIVLVENIETDPDPVRDFGDDETPPAPWFRNEPTQNDNYEINTRTFTYFGTHRIILFHVNPDYALLYDDEDNTSQNLTTPATDIENGFGIFTGLNSDTLWMEVYEE